MWTWRFGPYVLLLAVYAAGLTHGLSRPWTGMHDWNGAFFSQLARNFLRYPMSAHHGMPVVAVGQAVPSPEERSLYATHPPGLVWLVAASFRVLGESEWAARWVAVMASLGTWVLLVHLVDRGWGRATALSAGVIYAVLPMAVYFGRMVNHEPVCLLLMLAAIAAWPAVVDDGVPRRRRLWARALWAASVSAAIWIDWSGVLFAALFAAYAVAQRVRGRIDRAACALAWGGPLLASGGMLAYLVYAGLEGRWGDLVAIFLSRATDVGGEVVLKDRSAPGDVWDYVVENLTWPVIVLSLVGLAWMAAGRWRDRSGRRRPARDDAAQRGVPGGWILPATGVLWLAVFWRQFERHNYWMFYLGPAAAVLSACALSAVRDGLHRVGVGWGLGAMLVGLVVVVGFGMRGTDRYFSRVSYPPQEVAAWREVHDRTRAGDRVLLYRNPVRLERRGDYLFRNLVPPQQAYYLDRAFDVEADFQAVVRRAPRYAAYIIPIRDAVSQGAGLGALRVRFAEAQAVSKVFFDLRVAAAGDEPGVGRRVP